MKKIVEKVDKMFIFKKNALPCKY